jgi:hypothetical protein
MAAPLDEGAGHMLANDSGKQTELVARAGRPVEFCAGQLRAFAVQTEFSGRERKSLPDQFGIGSSPGHARAPF